MLLSYILLFIMAVALLYGAAAGNGAAVSGAVMEGAEAAVELCFSMLGPICLWSAVLEVMGSCGVSQALSRMTAPLLKRLFPGSYARPDCARALSANFTANLLGLGNAATPAGLEAAGMMEVFAPERELCRLVVMNSASLQLLPTTVAALRSSLGALSAFDILPCVWISSLCSVLTGLAVHFLLEREDD